MLWLCLPVLALGQMLALDNITRVSINANTCSKGVITVIRLNSSEYGGVTGLNISALSSAVSVMQSREGSTLFVTLTADAVNAASRFGLCLPMALLHPLALVLCGSLAYAQSGSQTITITLPPHIELDVAQTCFSVQSASVSAGSPSTAAPSRVPSTRAPGTTAAPTRAPSGTAAPTRAPSTAVPSTAKAPTTAPTTATAPTAAPSASSSLTAFESSSNAVIINFLTQRAYGPNLAIPLNEAVSFSRSGAADAENAAGALVSFADNAPRITDQGLIMESGTTLLLQNAFNAQQWTTCSATPTKLAVDKGFYPFQYTSPKTADCTPPTFDVVAGQPFIFKIRYSAVSGTYNSNSSLEGALQLSISIAGKTSASYGYTGDMGGATISNSAGTFNNSYLVDTYIGNGIWEYQHVFQPTVSGSCKLNFRAAKYPVDGAPVIMYGIQAEMGTSLSSWSRASTRNAEFASFTTRIQSIINSATTNRVYAMDYTGLVIELTKSSSLPVPFQNVVKIGIFSFALSDVQKLTWAYQKKMLRGVNLAGAEFDGSSVWPKNSLIDYYANKRIDNVRLPFLWERLQPTLRGALASSYVQELDRVVNRTTMYNITVQLDMHNYERRSGDVIGEVAGGATADDFADIWSRLATRYLNNPFVILGLMNEPHDCDIPTLISVQSAAARAIRATGFKGLILYSASGWTGAVQFQSTRPQDAYVPSNYPSNVGPVAFDIHSYLDSDSSGTHEECRAGAGGSRLRSVTEWARKNQVSLFLGEFAGGNTAQCAIEVANHINFMESNRDVWKGWTVWGANFPSSYIFAIDPVSGVDKPLLSFYTPFFNKTF